MFIARTEDRTLVVTLQLLPSWTTIDLQTTRGPSRPAMWVKVSRLRWFIKGQAKEGRRGGGEFNCATGEEFSDIRWDVGLFMASVFTRTRCLGITHSPLSK